MDGGVPTPSIPSVCRVLFFSQFQREHDLASVVPFGVLAPSNFMGHVSETTKIPIVASSVGFLEQMQLSAIDFVIPDGAVSSGHFHVAELTFPGIKKIRL